MNKLMRTVALRAASGGFLALLLVTLVAPGQAAILLSEILADPAQDWDGNGTLSSRGDEWIEVMNTGPATVALSDYYLRDALGVEPHLRLSGSLEPGEVAVFYGSDADAWQAGQGLPVTGLSLNNTGDTVEMHLGDPRLPGAQLVDAYIFADHEAEDDRASGRMTDLTWGLFDGLNPYGGSQAPIGTGCMPSPGIPNLCHPGLTDEGTTWGHMKETYR
jgi:hypothetical protein